MNPSESYLFFQSYTHVENDTFLNCVQVDSYELLDLCLCYFSRERQFAIFQEPVIDLRERNLRKWYQNYVGTHAHADISDKYRRPL